MTKYYAPQPKQVKPKYVKPKPKVRGKVIIEGTVMSKIGQKKKKANWESECVMCANCLHFRDSNTYLKNSLPITTVRHCGKWGFTTKLTSICDDWVDIVTRQPCVNPDS